MRGGNCLGDDQPSTATWTGQRENAGRLIGIAAAVLVSMFVVWGRSSEQLPDPGDIGGTVAVFKEAVVADAVLVFWQNVDQEPADELARLRGHGLVPTGATDAVILDAEGDALVVHTDQATVGNCDTVCVSR